MTVCPDFFPHTFIKSDYYPYKQDFFFRYEKHSTLRHFFEYEEYLVETVDERRLNLTYTEILDKIEVGEIKPNDLGMKM